MVSSSLEALAGRLQAVEQALAAQRSRELETMQGSNRIMLIVAGAFATIGLLALVLMAWFQWRTISGLAAISAAFPIARALGSSPAMRALGMGAAEVTAAGPAEQSNLRLLGALEQLEKRLHDLEHTAAAPPAAQPAAQPAARSDGPATDAAQTGPAPLNGEDEELATANGKPTTAPTPTSSPDEAQDGAGLLAKGQSLLEHDDAQGALACFERLLQADPGNAEALVKKGASLERLQKLEAAIECYDRAIAADGSLTIAYLHKGGLFNRLERFDEALACYEQALRTQEKRGG
jgi:tetratricopeptide (TPR) repeat protein